MFFKSIILISLTLVSIQGNLLRIRKSAINKTSVINSSDDIPKLNNRPIIGILSQEFDPISSDEDAKNKHYIAASYVKFIEGSGARAAPIFVGKPESYYEDILMKINGVIFPGGDALFNNTNGFADTAKHVYKIAKRINENGTYFPIMGICLGFEVLTFLEANGTEHRTKCSSMKQPLPLEFREDFRRSRLFNDIPEDILTILKTQNVTANYHQFCITEEALAKVNISKSFRIISLNKDWNGFEFISTFEHVNYPFYGLQFHPEKNNYEWVINRNVPHGFNATLAGRYFADFIVNEARKNLHSFSDLEEESKNLIYNYPVCYTAAEKSIFLQLYLFSRNDTVKVDCPKIH